MTARRSGAILHAGWHGAYLLGLLDADAAFDTIVDRLAAATADDPEALARAAEWLSGVELQPPRLELGLLALEEARSRQVRPGRERARARETSGRAADEHSAPGPHAVLAVIVHELVTPLSVIRLAVDTALERRQALTGESLRDFLGLIDRHARLALAELDRADRVLQLDQGMLRLDLRRVDAGALVQELAHDLGPLLRDHRLSLAVSDTLMADVDVDAVREILIALIVNATEHAPGGTRIEVTAGADGGAVVVTVSDDGPGIPEEDRSRIFGRREQLSPESGQGLGLPIARELARAHGGDVTVDTAPDGGARFALVLPRRAGRSGP